MAPYAVKKIRRELPVMSVNRKLCHHTAFDLWMDINVPEELAVLFKDVPRDSPTNTDRMGDANVTESKWRHVEVGRVVLFSQGPYAGKLAAIVQIIDHKRVRSSTTQQQVRGSTYSQSVRSS
ncbi:hypothetical protein LTR50_002092 [Elasticomyces elasticus]|nr:hypothetical protein LTR50_002092 [Elasticomyces elasticus]